LLVRKLTVPPAGLPGEATVTKPIGNRHSRESDRAFGITAVLSVVIASGISSGETMATTGASAARGAKNQPPSPPNMIIPAKEIARIVAALLPGLPVKAGSGPPRTRSGRSSTYCLSCILIPSAADRPISSASRILHRLWTLKPTKTVLMMM